MKKKLSFNLESKFKSKFKIFTLISASILPDFLSIVVTLAITIEGCLSALNLKNLNNRIIITSINSKLFSNKRHYRNNHSYYLSHLNQSNRLHFSLDYWTTSRLLESDVLAGKYKIGSLQLLGG